MNICTYNVRTLRTESDLLGLLEELALIKWEIVGLSEVRRLGEDQKILNDGHVLCWRGKSEGNKQELGVGFLIHKRLEKNFIEFHSVSERVASVILKLNEKYSVKNVQVYAPTSSHSDEEVESFYEDVHTAIDRNQTHFLVVMGDFNAKVGRRVDQETSVGQHGIGTRNERGQMLVDFAESRSLYILNTLFEKKENRKWTWKSPSGTKNEIDFVISNKRNIAKNVSVINKVNVGSDHRMVRCEFKVNLKLERKKLIRDPLPNLTKQNDQVDEYRAAIQNRFLALTDENLDVDEINDQIISVVKDAAIEVVGKNKKQKSSNLSLETKQLMQRRRNMKAMAVRDKIELVELTKTINKKKKEDVRKFNMEKINEAVVHGTSLKTAKRKLGIGTSQMFAIRKPDGEITHNKKDLVKVVEDFYRELYSGNDLTQTEVNIQTRDITDVKVDEVKKALKSMKRGKAAGEDGVSVDILKAGGDVVIAKLANLFTKCLKDGKTPTSWKNAVVVLLHKKGDTKDLKNYRPISLLSVLYKLFTRVITNRIGNTLDANQPREQAGFRSGFSTIDHIHAVNQVIEKTNEYRKPLCMVFIDYEKAFYSVEIEGVLEAVRKQGVEEVYCRILEHIYRDGTATIKLHTETEKISNQEGSQTGRYDIAKTVHCMFRGNI